MQINWTNAAENDLDQIFIYISKDNEKAAFEVISHIINSVEKLIPTNTAIGRPGRIFGTRELVITKYPYIVPYRVKENTIDILRVLHNSMKWPDNL